ncbi:hypothetical protein WH96_05635 [Kiloniella spongiae]|uniref:Uncharacterized protein n=1 Tax=Kiloniella spongiae TaxID=1489064 RepID=A0A0H2MYG2_9PROT|nr:hypothetical protein [Kiloniella spongiae]KLN61775.1 hypothetical protein WH96_05635 [Kiloniella spongiae]
MKWIMALFALSGILLSGQTAMAEETALNTAQIKELLVGKTVEGIHFGSHTRQYFSKSGLTLWIKNGDAEPSEARYKVENDKYCSSWTGLWAEPEWGCFSIHHDKDQGLYYYISDDFRAPFIIGKTFSLDAN